MKNYIEHTAIIKDIRSDHLQLNLLNVSSCAGCHAKSVCNVTESDAKTIEVPIKKGSYKIGQEVKVVIDKSLGPKALFIGYLIPFLLVIFLLIVMTSLGGNELQAAVISMSILLPYYFLVFLFNDKLERIFEMRVLKSDEKI